MSARTNGLGSNKAAADSTTALPETPMQADSATTDKVEGLKISETLQQGAEKADANGPNPLKMKGRTCDFTGCEKRLKLTDMARPCLCTKIFCDSHRFYLTHKCTFDHAARDRAKLEASMQQRRFNYNTQNPGGSGVN